MGFFAKLFGLHGAPAYENTTPENRLEMLRKKEVDSKVKERIVSAQRLVGSTDSGNSKMAHARLEFSDLKHQRPLVWVNLVLAIYDQGHPVFDEIIGSCVRDALKQAQDELVKTPDEKKQKLFEAIEKDIETRKLTSLKFLQQTVPTAALPQMTTMQSAFEAIQDGRPLSAPSDNLLPKQEVEK